jgi:hypothetical protein
MLAVFLWAESVARLVALQGEVHIRRDNMLMLSKAGMELTLADVVDSREDGRARVVFHDETVVTVGPDTTFSIAAFSQESGDEEIMLENRRGALRVITGQIGKIAPDQFKVRTRTATIGVRGTQFAVAIDESEESILCTEGTIELTLLGAAGLFREAEWVKPAFGLKPQPAKESSKRVVLGAGDLVKARFKSPAPLPDVPQIAPLASLAATAFEPPRRAEEKEVEAIVERVADAQPAVMDPAPVINEYRQIMKLPPQEPLIIRELNLPESNPQMRIPRLRDQIDSDALQQELTP